MQNSINDMWLRGLAAQHSLLQLATYNVALAGAACVQSAQMGVNAPQAFWSAMARATDSDTTP